MTRHYLAQRLSKSCCSPRPSRLCGSLGVVAWLGFCRILVSEGRATAWRSPRGPRGSGFRLHLVLALAVALLSGCETTPDDEKGADHTVGYYLKVEASEQGVSIETNGVFAGKAPMLLHVFGDKN